jgi:hypothetical protein
MSQKQANVASEALGVLTDQVFGHIKLATPALEDLAKAAKAYHSAMELANQAANAFIDSFGKVRVLRKCQHEIASLRLPITSQSYPSII